MAPVFKVIVPTLNPGPFARVMASSIRAQRSQPSEVVIVDSGSEDYTGSFFREVGFTTHKVSSREFDHGATRNLGVTLAEPADVVILLTQDVALEDDMAFTHLLAPFEDEKVALVCGRQLPRTGAGPIEAHARAFNYPTGENSRTLEECGGLGIKAIFNSNAFAAYRVKALRDVGGFPMRTIMGEDQIAAAKLLLAGWKVTYNGKAVARHSHAYNLVAEFKRYYDIGVFHESQRELLAPFGAASKEGGKFVKSELRYLLTEHPQRIPEALTRTALKLLAYRCGRLHDRTPKMMNRLLAMNSAYFTQLESHANR